jgi:hypothetical protein
VGAATVQRRIEECYRCNICHLSIVYGTPAKEHHSLKEAVQAVWQSHYTRERGFYRAYEDLIEHTWEDDLPGTSSLGLHPNPNPEPPDKRMHFSGFVAKYCPGWWTEQDYYPLRDWVIVQELMNSLGLCRGDRDFQHLVYDLPKDQCLIPAEYKRGHCPVYLWHLKPDIAEGIKRIWLQKHAPVTLTFRGILRSLFGG